MTNEDQIAALFADANPVPSLDVFDPVEPLDMDRLEKRPERSRGMTDTKTDNGKVATPNRWPRLAILVAIPVVAVVAAVVLLTDKNGSVASPVSVATAFMNAIAEHDGNAARELFAPEGAYGGIELSDLPTVLDHDRAIGWDYVNQGCEERTTDSAGTLVVCPYLFENDWMRALSLEPASGSYEILVTDDQIQSATEIGDPNNGIGEAYRAFRTWVNTNHPDDVATMFGPGDEILRNTDSIPLYEQYTDEFVASASAPSITAAEPETLRSGALPVGTYTVTPFAPPGDEGPCMAPPQPGCSDSNADDSIRVTFIVPDGWSGAPLRSIWLTTGRNSAPGGAGLIFNRGGWLHSDPCRNDAANPDIQVGPTVDDFANALADHPLLEVTTPVDISLGGYSGKYVDLQVPSDFTDCNRYFAWEPGLYAQGPSQRWHLWILDVDGVRVVVETSDYPGTSAEDQAELQGIVDSIQIEP